jgi:hypothetical protein
LNREVTAIHHQEHVRNKHNRFHGVGYCALLVFILLAGKALAKARGGADTLVQRIFAGVTKKGRWARKANTVQKGLLAATLGGMGFNNYRFDGQNVGTACMLGSIGKVLISFQVLATSGFIKVTLKDVATGRIPISEGGGMIAPLN